MLAPFSWVGDLGRIKALYDRHTFNGKAIVDVERGLMAFG